MTTSAETELEKWRQHLIGESSSILEICEIVQLVASKRCTILISGETGSGKGVIARAIHAASDRAAAPLVSVNCSALPATLVETELFGHAKGAFTGAQTSRIGRFEQAHRGTIFLDEIGDLPFDVQAKLLRVLQEREFERVGSSETVRADVRVIAASNVDLESAVRERRFREDLFYRLNVVPIHMPPLRHRREDIPLLVRHFLHRLAISENTLPKQVSADVFAHLQKFDWPGNVRQLEHAVQMACALSGQRLNLEIADFYPRRSAFSNGGAGAGRPLLQLSRAGIDFDSAVEDFERSLVQQALTLTNGNKSQAADLLRIKRTTLLAKLKSFETPSSLALAC